MVGDCILIDFGDDHWESFRVDFKKSDQDGHDVAVFSVSDFPVEWGYCQPSGFAIISTQHYLVGFPSGFVAIKHASKYASPLIKSGIYMGVAKISGVKVMLVDAFNNQGFSGGPVFAVDESANFNFEHDICHGRFDRINMRPSPKVVGVVNGYRYDARTAGQVYTDKGGSISPVEHYFVRPNSGITTCTPFDVVEKLVESI